ncbi:hypothetical protein [Methyloglobulus sp.]|uniref:hypothetical protein n=1 Tax=Methyloglobulus sp. TaxID=2518622 RepID=UPI0032B82A6D
MSKDRSVILDYIKSAKPRSTGHKILSQDEFLGGNVAQIEYSDNSQTLTQWVIVTKQHKGYADSESQLIQQLESASNKDRERVDWINQVFNISGLIALILVCASVYLTINTPNGNIPEHLKASVLTIVGFYFGGLVKGKKNQASA